jgi:hypothetical protein
MGFFRASIKRPNSLYQMLTIKQYWSQLLNHGILPTDDFAFRRQMRLGNLILISIGFLILPATMVWQIIQGSMNAFWSSAILSPMVLIALYLHRNRQVVASFILGNISFLFTVSWYTIMEAKEQYTYIFGVLFIGISAYYVLTHWFWKPFVALLDFAVFVYLYHYQSSSYPYIGGQKLWALSFILMLLFFTLHLFAK